MFSGSLVATTHNTLATTQQLFYILYVHFSFILSFKLPDKAFQAKSKTFIFSF